MALRLSHFLLNLPFFKASISSILTYVLYDMNLCFFTTLFHYSSSFLFSFFLSFFFFFQESFILCFQRAKSVFSEPWNTSTLAQPRKTLSIFLSTEGFAVISGAPGNFCLGQGQQARSAFLGFSIWPCIQIWLFNYVSFHSWSNILWRSVPSRDMQGTLKVERIEGRDSYGRQKEVTFQSGALLLREWSADEYCEIIWRLLEMGSLRP